MRGRAQGRAAKTNWRKTRRRKATKPNRPGAPKVSGRRKPANTNADTKIALLKRERDEAIEQQKATAEVLRVVSASPGDLKPAFSVILENATRLCQANFGVLYLCEKNAYRAVAMHNAPSAFIEARHREPLVSMTGTTVLAEVARTKRTIQIADMAKHPAYQKNPRNTRLLVKLAGARSVVTVPMLKANELVGAITIYRQEVRPFTDMQIALLQSFAAQAVIAIENTRLLNELRQRTTDLTESLEQQTATSEVLQVISASPGELSPVFDTILESATRICEAKYGILFSSDGKLFNKIAVRNVPQALLEFLEQRGAFLPVPATALHDMLTTRSVVHQADASASPGQSASVRLGGAKSFVAVPMFKDEALVGAIAIYRQEVRPFSDKQIALVENFAAQAVIAIENTRLLNELRQSLEQQTATSNVLRVISSSPGALEPVFAAMLENATRICDAKFGIMTLYEGRSFRAVALHNAPPEFAEARRREPLFLPAPNNPLARVAATKETLQIPDLRLDESYLSGEQATVIIAERGGARTLIDIPMLNDGELVGVFGIYRQEVRPFTVETGRGLLQNFAAQAVIAIENTRLLSELRESLEQQTATSEVLGVISKSPGELQPVFQAMLENAIRICDAKFGTLFRFDGELADRVASAGTPAALVEFQLKRGPFKPSVHANFARCLETKTVVHVADELAEPKPGAAMDMAALGELRFMFQCSRRGEAIGEIVIYRQEVRPFTDKQIELVKNFATQAVIAIENTWLLNELRLNRAATTRPPPQRCLMSSADQSSICSQFCRAWLIPQRAFVALIWLSYLG